MADLALVTIPFSHYCEKARWALERAGLSFAENAHLPMAHYVPALVAGGGRTVPVLRTPDGVIGDSTAILGWIDRALPAEKKLFPADEALASEVRRWEDRFDDVLGPAARRWAYGYVLQDRPRTEPMLRRNVPAYEAAGVRLLFPVVKALIAKGLNVNPAACARSLGRLHEVFDEVSTALGDGRRYLAGERFSAADLTFASLATPVLYPPQHARWVCNADDLGAEMRGVVEEFRATPAGAFGLRLYAEDRA